MLHGVPILVKREDLASPLPGPKFSKIRGVVAHIKNRPEPIIGVLDTLHSKAGWAVSYVCHNLGKTAVNYWPRFKRDPREGLPRIQQQMAEGFGAHMVEMPAGRSSILYHRARSLLFEDFGEASYMMPNALKLPESVTENAEEARITALQLPMEGTLVISISSGTVAAGVLLGFHQAGILDNYFVILHMGYSRSRESVLGYMEKASGLKLEGRVMLIDEGYTYADEVRIQAPFPINPHYDAKAWKWLSEAIQSEENKMHPGSYQMPIVFWSIGD